MSAASTALDVLAYVILFVAILGVVACANWDSITSWWARIDDCADSMVEARGFGDWSDEAQLPPFDWRKDMADLGRPVADPAGLLGPEAHRQMREHQAAVAEHVWNEFLRPLNRGPRS